MPANESRFIETRFRIYAFAISTSLLLSQVPTRSRASQSPISRLFLIFYPLIIYLDVLASYSLHVHILSRAFSNIFPRRAGSSLCLSRGMAGRRGFPCEERVCNSRFRRRILHARELQVPSNLARMKATPFTRIHVRARVPIAPK